MKKNFYISFGTWLIILPFLGVPIFWKNILVAISGLFLVLVALGPSILKKLQSKPKSRSKKETASSNPFIVKEEDENSSL